MHLGLILDTVITCFPPQDSEVHNGRSPQGDLRNTIYNDVNGQSNHYITECPSFNGFQATQDLQRGVETLWTWPGRQTWE